MSAGLPVPGPDGRPRCPWSLGAPDYLGYHDDECGRPVRDDDDLFERLCLEAFQSGLSWLTILRKRDNFRAAFSGFRIEAVAGFGPADVSRLLADAGIVRNRAKIEAAIGNARAATSLPGGLAEVVLEVRRAIVQCLAAGQPCRRAVLDARFQGAVEGTAPSRLHLHRASDRLRVDAVVRRRQRSPGRLLLPGQVWACRSHATRPVLTSANPGERNPGPSAKAPGPSAKAPGPTQRHRAQAKNTGPGAKTPGPGQDTPAGSSLAEDLARPRLIGPARKVALAAVPAGRKSSYCQTMRSHDWQTHGGQTLGIDLSALTLAAGRCRGSRAVRLLRRCGLSGGAASRRAAAEQRGRGRWRVASGAEVRRGHLGTGAGDRRPGGPRTRIRRARMGLFSRRRQEWRVRRQRMTRRETWLAPAGRWSARPQFRRCGSRSVQLPVASGSPVASGRSSCVR